MTKEAIKQFWSRHKWKTCLIPIIIAILWWRQSTVEIITQKVETEKTAKIEAQTSRDTWKTKAEKYKENLDEALEEVEEEIPVFHPTTGVFVGMRNKKTKTLRKHLTRSGSSDLMVQIKELEKRIEVAFEKGKTEGRKETRPAAKSFNLGVGIDLKGRFLAGGGIDAELLGLQASVTALAVIPATPLDFRAYGAQVLLLLHR